MQRLQALLNSLVGIHHNEAILRARARTIFDQPNDHFQGMEVPAYLRRRARIGIQIRWLNHRLTNDRRLFSPSGLTNFCKPPMQATIVNPARVGRFKFALNKGMGIWLTRIIQGENMVALFEATTGVLQCEQKGKYTTWSPCSRWSVTIKTHFCWSEEFLASVGSFWPSHRSLVTCHRSCKRRIWPDHRIWSIG